MRRAALLVAAALLLASGGRAGAAVHQATVGNYYFQDDATNDRAKLVVVKGDQVTVTVRATASRPHSVNVDELGIHSGDLLLFETYTTPPLNRVGTFRLYCRNHAVSNNHVTSLVVRAPPTPATPVTAPATTAPPRTSPTPRLVPSAATTPPAASSTTVAPSTTAPTQARSGATATTGSAVTVPAGRGEAPPGDRRRATPAANSLEGLLGRHIGGTAPWTRAVRIGLAALVPLVVVAAFALREARRREAVG